MKQINKYIKIYGMFLKCSLMKQMEYRVNFIMMIGIEGVFLITKLLYAYIVYDTGVIIYGFSPDMIIFYIGTFILMTGIYMFLFYFNFSSISSLIRNGDLDILITKPISLQFMLTMKQVDYGTPIPNIIAGICIVTYQWNKIGLPAGFIQVLGYIVCIIIGSLVGYSIMFCVQLISFFTIKADAAREITDSLWDVNNMPMFIYNKYIRVVGCTVIPIFIVTNYPALFALNKLNGWQLTGGIFLCVLLFILVRGAFHLCMKQYTSASS
jgi:ABC-2 type transport system permease protein